VHTPQQNGRAERINRTLIEKTRALLTEKDLSKDLWAAAIQAAAIQAAAFIHNVTPSARQEVTRHELFYGEPADIARLRVFGCLAYPLTPEPRRKKLDARSEPGLFIGYAQDSKAWRILPCCLGKASAVETANVRLIEDSRPEFDQLKDGYEGNSTAADDFIETARAQAVQSGVDAGAGGAGAAESKDANREGSDDSEESDDAIGTDIAVGSEGGESNLEPDSAHDSDDDEVHALRTRRCATIRDNPTARAIRSEVVAHPIGSALRAGP
jgi:hypothetical protein